MANRIAYEDVLTASEQIYRCTANALDVSEPPQTPSFSILSLCGAGGQRTTAEPFDDPGTRLLSRQPPS